jgi:hypothetical protein
MTANTVGVGGVCFLEAVLGVEAAQDLLWLWSGGCSGDRSSLNSKHNSNVSSSGGSTATATTLGTTSRSSGHVHVHISGQA